MSKTAARDHEHGTRYALFACPQLPGRAENLRRQRRGRLPNGRPLGEEGRRAGDEHHLRAGQADVQARRVEGPLPGPQALRREQARVLRGDPEGGRIHHRPPGRLQQGRHAGRAEPRRRPQDSPRKVNVPRIGNEIYFYITCTVI